MALALAAVPATAAARPDACTGKGRRTLRINRVTRVFEREGRVFACWRASGRRTFLFLADDIYESGRVDYVSQRYVAYERDVVPACKADCPPGVGDSYQATIVDVRTGRRTVLTRTPVQVLVVTAGGAAAWLTGDPPFATLRARDASGRRVLGTGDIWAGSVKLSGRTLRWVEAGAGRTTVLT